MTTTTPLGRAVAARVQTLTASPARIHDAETSTSAPVRAAAIAAMAAHDCDHYTRRPGIAPLCRRVAQALQDVDITVDPDNGVVISGGPAETRFVTLRTLGEGATIHVPQGLAAPYAAGAALAGATLVEYAPDAAFGTTAGVWIWRSEQPAIVSNLAADATLVVDVLDATETVPADLEQFAPAHVPAEQLLILGGFGRETGLDAWNVAWFAGAKPLVATVRTLKQAMTICTPAPGQYAALAIFEGATA